MMQNEKFSNKPIGVFDSGVGGLSILKELVTLMPYDDFIYLGDTKNLPYGNKTKEEIINFGRKTINFFKSKGVETVVMACNTSSALAYDTLTREFPETKIFSLIASCASEIAKNNNLTIMATEGTVKSGKYEEEIKKHNKNAKVTSLACHDFVRIVENKLYDDKKCIEYVYSMLDEALAKNPEKIVLGCTHYPYLIPIFSKKVDKNIFINPAKIFAEVVKSYFKNPIITHNKGETEFYVTNDPDAFIQSAKVFYEINEEVRLIY